MKNVKDSAGHRVDCEPGTPMPNDPIQGAFAYRTNRFNFTPRWHIHLYAALQSGPFSIKFQFLRNVFPHL